MPVAMQERNNDQPWCFPLPLIEENQRFISYRADGPVILEKPGQNNISAAPVNGLTTQSHLKTVNKTPLHITFDANNKSKKGLRIKDIAQSDKVMNSVNGIITGIKKSLVNREVSSQHKSSEYNVISHYERIDDKSPAIGQRFTSASEGPGLPDNAEHNVSDTRTYRLQKLEFRRTGTLSHIAATLPVPLLNMSNKNSITLDQHLGEIEFLYDNDIDILPTDIKRRINILY
ncbi:hypothetical protein [Erwinia psidii]|uniref:Uncharacterized protein n=1 Tax=Erwinia psidii TaxID=69224 RepID=A0A3N6V1I8_9GAMM|nr:hypothetical protein [Erwinia psidii]MCX8958732.1 hypothetical protein [Erwinia psidii]RQM38935.1 hypothetical protein EB241_07035 [Erwinia psidii]